MHDALTDTRSKEELRGHPVIGIFSRRYLLAWGVVAKYLGFRGLCADSQGLGGINPKYLTTASVSGILFQISPFENLYARLKLKKEL